MGALQQPSECGPAQACGRTTVKYLLASSQKSTLSLVSKELQLSFPRLIDDRKPLISRAREKVEFRLIVNQRVLETSFFINAGDVLDGSEGVLYLPSAFTDSKEIAQQ